MEKIKELRLKKGVSQESLARYLGVTVATVSRYETGDREPDHDTLLKMAEYFEVSMDSLFGKDKTPAPVHDDEALDLMEQMHKRPELRVLFSTTQKATKEDIEAVDNILKRMVGGNDE